MGRAAGRAAVGALVPVKRAGSRIGVNDRARFSRWNSPPPPPRDGFYANRPAVVNAGTPRFHTFANSLEALDNG